MINPFGIIGISLFSITVSFVCFVLVGVFFCKKSYEGIVICFLLGNIFGFLSLGFSTEIGTGAVGVIPRNLSDNIYRFDGQVSTLEGKTVLVLENKERKVFAVFYDQTPLCSDDMKVGSYVRPLRKKDGGIWVLELEFERIKEQFEGVKAEVETKPKNIPTKKEG